MFIRFAAVIPLSLALAGAPILAGQASQALAGSRVRLHTIGGEKLEGSLIAMDVDSLTLHAQAGEISVPRAAIQSLETWRGRGSQWRSGFEIGWLAGFAAASAVFATRMRNCVGLACENIKTWETYAARRGLAGAVLGGLIGAVFRHDRWERVPVHPEIAVGPSDEGIGLSIRF